MIQSLVLHVTMKEVSLSGCGDGWFKRLHIVFTGQLILIQPAVLLGHKQSEYVVLSKTKSQLNSLH